MIRQWICVWVVVYIMGVFNIWVRTLVYVKQKTAYEVRISDLSADVCSSDLLIHDGTRLVLVSRWPGCCVRLALAPGLEDGMAYLYAIRACAAPCARYRALAAGLDALSAATEAAPMAAARSRPTPAAVLELHTLQALDATLAGASLREVAGGLFGTDAGVADRHAHSALRARARRLAPRGAALMRGGYRRLAQIGRESCGERVCQCV